MNLQFAPGIVDEMVKSVLGRDTALPLLQFALRALWEQRDRNRITREVYQRIGRSASDGLLVGWQLQEVAARSDLGPLEAAYVKASVDAADAERAARAGAPTRRASAREQLAASRLGDRGDGWCESAAGGGWRRTRCARRPPRMRSPAGRSRRLRASPAAYRPAA